MSLAKKNAGPASAHSYAALPADDIETADPDSDEARGRTSIDMDPSLTRASLRHLLQAPEKNNEAGCIHTSTHWGRNWVRYLILGGVLAVTTVVIVLLVLKPWQDRHPLAPVYNDAVKALPDEQPIWPIPRTFSFGTDKVLLSPDFKINVQLSSNSQTLPLAVGSSYPILEKAIARCMDRLQIKRNTTIPPTAPDVENYNNRTMAAGTALVLTELVITVDDAQAALEFGMIESYSLEISTTQESAATGVYLASYDKRGPVKRQDTGAIPSGVNAVLTAGTQWGVIHGLETFTQLVRASAAPTGTVDTTTPGPQQTENLLDIPNVPWTIKDTPRFSHRGILLDTSRNYFPVKDIIRTLEAMSLVKLNVFHWHVLDQQSYPLVSKAFPDLSAKGAERPDLVYTLEDVAAIIQYGKERGIRVLPEFDAPGHTASWGRAFPNITVCLDQQPHNVYAAEPPAGQLDPLEPFTYTVLETLIKEWSAQFPDSQVHAGGDEVSFKCWKTSDRLADYIKNPGHRAEYEKNLPGSGLTKEMEKGMRRTGSGSQNGEDRLLEVYLDRALAMFLGGGKRVIVWEEIALEHNVKLPESAIVQVWKNAANAKRVIEQGRPVILSSAEYWYLDCGSGAWSIGSKGNSWCSYSNWQRIYSYSLTDELNAEQQKMVYGGEVCMWAEQTSSSNLDPNLWPRSAAAAEVLWSGTRDEQGQIRPLMQATKRLIAARERLLQIGVAAAPMFPSWCRKHPEACLA
ncbi:glycoside hydrolase superfamily [Dissophora ornata]|nr:glycoside hydrolase superfamily [Dissophora ornata]